MSTLAKFLLILGLIFPTLSWLTAMLSLWTRWISNRFSSPVFIPLIGPICLTGFILVDGRSLWFIPTAWVLDIGTVAFAIASPRLLREYWETSPFTRITTLSGESGIQAATLTLHTTGCYLLKKSWNRPKGKCGVVGLGEPGNFSVSGDDFEMTSHCGLKRRLVRVDEHSFLVEEHIEDHPGSSNSSLQGWLLKS